MKVLVFGPSGSGKTYISHILRENGIAAFDADEISGLSSWYDRSGRKVPAPATSEEAISDQYSFLWSKKYLTAFLSAFSDVYIFGASGNIFKMFDLFDRVYFLKIDAETQRKRLWHAPDRDAHLDFRQDELIIWGQWLEEAAKQKNIPFIDGTLPPLVIYSMITGRP